MGPQNQNQNNPLLKIKNNDRRRMDSVLSFTSSASTETKSNNTTLTTLTNDTRSTVTMYSTINRSENELTDNEQNVLLKEYESDIPDFIIMIFMKYYGADIQGTEFKMFWLLLLMI